MHRRDRLPASDQAHGQSPFDAERLCRLEQVLAFRAANRPIHGRHLDRQLERQPAGARLRQLGSERSQARGATRCGQGLLEASHELPEPGTNALVSQLPDRVREDFVLFCAELTVRRRAEKHRFHQRLELVEGQALGDGGIGGHGGRSIGGLSEARLEALTVWLRLGLLAVERPPGELADELGGVAAGGEHELQS